jgi:hypothetical protein
MSRETATGRLRHDHQMDLIRRNPSAFVGICQRQRAIWNIAGQCTLCLSKALRPLNSLLRKRLTKFFVRRGRRRSLRKCKNCIDLIQQKPESADTAKSELVKEEKKL